MADWYGVDAKERRKPGEGEWKNGEDEWIEREEGSVSQLCRC